MLKLGSAGEAAMHRPILALDQAVRRISHIEYGFAVRICLGKLTSDIR